jgi:hypothetical protein
LKGQWLEGADSVEKPDNIKMNFLPSDKIEDRLASVIHVIVEFVLV